MGTTCPTWLCDWEGDFDAMLRDNERFGSSLAAPGDLNGDGVPDLVVGGTMGISVLFLKPDGKVKQHERMAAEQAAFGIEQVGSSLCVGSRLNGASEVRLAVGGSVARSETESDGAVWLLRLRSDGVVSSQ
jgi:hypothetical protein